MLAGIKLKTQLSYSTLVEKYILTRGPLTALLVQIKKSKIKKKFYKTKNDNLPARKICKSAANVIFPFLETPTLTFEHIPRLFLKGEGTNHKMENVWSPYNISSTKNPK